MSSDNLGSFTSLTTLGVADALPRTDRDQEKDKTKEKISSTLVKQHHTFRTTLPALMNDRKSTSIWSILKQCVDKELYRFTIPIVWNEPLSLLQRMAENIRYSNELLDKAANMNNPLDRMKCVAGFIVSTTSIHVHRLSKPFNPLLGETYEFISTRGNYRICSEQVSHHPPVSAYYSESTLSTISGEKKWKYYGSVYPNMKLNLLNACIDACVDGIQTIELPEHGEVYTWNNLKVTAHNLIIGKLWFEYTGHIEIINHKLNIKCVLDFKPFSWFTRQLNRCEGYILDSNHNKVVLLSGKWDECFYATSDVKQATKFARDTEKLISNEKETQLTGIECIWKTIQVDLKPEFFSFSPFTFQLNELYDELQNDSRIEVTSVEKNKNSGESLLLTNSVSIGPLAPTDSRFRPDMRFYESGAVNEASSHKHRLEEKQREKQKKTESGEAEAFAPIWFEKKNHSVVRGEETWSFNNKYWNRDWSKCPDIY